MVRPADASGDDAARLGDALVGLRPPEEAAVLVVDARQPRRVGVGLARARVRQHMALGAGHDGRVAVARHRHHAVALQRGAAVRRAVPQLVHAQPGRAELVAATA